jgi:hypothetical protein
MSRPLLRVIRPDASDEEIAALLAVVLTRTGTTPDDEQPSTSAWSERAALLRRPHRPGPGAWRASGWQR